MVAVQDRQVRAWSDQIDSTVKIAGSGPPLVFLHGAGGLMWDPFLDALAETHTVYAPEFPGTSPGRPDEVRSLDGLWDLMLYYDELFEALGLEQPDIVGHSFGGMVAAEIAATYRNRAGKLVLIDPIGLWLDDHPVVNWMVTAPEALPSILFAEPEGPVATQMFTLPEDEEAALQQQVHLMWAQACTGKFVWPIPDKGLKKRLHRVQSPTLIIWGKQDGLISPVYADEFAKLMSNVQVELIDGAGHVPQLEQPEATIGKIRSFLG